MKKFGNFLLFFAAVLGLLVLPTAIAFVLPAPRTTVAPVPEPHTVDENTFLNLPQPEGEYPLLLTNRHRPISPAHTRPVVERYHPGSLLSRVYDRHAVRSVLSTYPESYSPQMQMIQPYLPNPNLIVHVPNKLTIQDAILLALRNNPNVVSSELQRIVDKYNVILAHWNFEPQYNLSGTMTTGSSGTPQYTLNSGVTLNTMVGTSASFNYTNSFSNLTNGSGTFTLTQPLLRGFGYVARIPWLDALDGNLSAEYGFQTQIISVVVGVISAYRTLVGDYNNLFVQQNNYKQTQTTVNQFKLQLKVGKAAASDLNQQLANLAQAKLGVVQQEDQLQNDYQQFLSTIGLVPNAKISIIKKINYKKYNLPTMRECIRLALEYNQGYQQAIIGLRQDARAIVTARDARKPQLNVVYTQPVTFNKVGVDPNAGGMATTTGSTVVASLDVPIDDVSAKAGLISAEVGYESAKLQLEQQKEDLIRQVMTQYRSLQIQAEAIELSENSVRLQEKTLSDAQIKFKYGKATMFEVIQDQNQLLQANVDLISQKTQYLNSITAFFQTLGTTLANWNIKLRY